MQVTQLHPHFDQLQKRYGSRRLDSIYGAGCTSQPNVCFVFMNPTGRNIASEKSWNGLKAPWIGTKNVWRLFQAVGLISDQTWKEIYTRQPKDWDYGFAEATYQELARKRAYVTNLGKCTQEDASPVTNAVFREYLSLLEQEIVEIQPKRIITFGNQVSSLFLGQNIKVSAIRKQRQIKHIGDNEYSVYAVHYPVGQGMRNLPLAIEDICYAMKARY